MESKLTWSGIIFIFLCFFILTFRFTHISKKEISWDVLGYYLYLPSTFIQQDPMLTDISWLKKLNDEQQLTGTFYQVSRNDKGEPMYFFLMGMSFFYFPFFLLGWAFSSSLGYPIDGFNTVFQHCLVIGGLIYTIIGLYFFRKILLKYFSDAIAAIVMVIVVIGTNYIHHLTLDNLATVNVLFMLCSILVWNTIQWHETKKTKYLIITGVSIMLMGLVKPSEIVIAVLPLLWGVSSKEGFTKKLELLKDQWKTVLVTILICLLIAMPQMIYWFIKTGKPLYDSYKNPGVGLDLFSPHILDTLFSYRKGWLIYTPVMIFSLIGFYFMYRNNRSIFLAILCYFIIGFYIISSWSEWWYGAAYSTRPMITMYPVLGICLGYFIQAASNWKVIYKSAIAILIVFFILLNQFQWWQFRSYILDPYRTTKKAYWSVFLKTNPDPSYKKHYLVERDFTGHFNFNNREGYELKTISIWNFENEKNDNIKMDSSGNHFYRMSADQEFSKTYQYKYSQLTDKDHIWLEASVDVRFPVNFVGPPPELVMSVEYKKGIYGYHTIQLKPESQDGKWHTYKLNYLTPEMRTDKDVFKCYVWKRSKEEIELDNFQLDMFEKIMD